MLGAAVCSVLFATAIVATPEVTDPSNLAKRGWQLSGRRSGITRTTTQSKDSDDGAQNVVSEPEWQDPFLPDTYGIFPPWQTGKDDQDHEITVHVAKYLDQVDGPLGLSLFRKAVTIALGSFANRFLDLVGYDDARMKRIMGPSFPRWRKYFYRERAWKEAFKVKLSPQSLEVRKERGKQDKATKKAGISMQQWKEHVGRMHKFDMDVRNAQPFAKRLNVLWGLLQPDAQRDVTTLLYRGTKTRSLERALKYTHGEENLKDRFILSAYLTYFGRLVTMLQRAAGFRTEMSIWNSDDAAMVFKFWARLREPHMHQLVIAIANLIERSAASAAKRAEELTVKMA